MSENKEQEVVNERNCVMIDAMDIFIGKWRYFRVDFIIDKTFRFIDIGYVRQLCDKYRIKITAS